jgi:hypothetical protein
MTIMTLIDLQPDSTDCNRLLTDCNRLDSVIFAGAASDIVWPPFVRRVLVMPAAELHGLQDLKIALPEVGVLEQAQYVQRRWSMQHDKNGGATEGA